MRTLPRYRISPMDDAAVVDVWTDSIYEIKEVTVGGSGDPAWVLARDLCDHLNHLQKEDPK